MSYEVCYSRYKELREQYAVTHMPSSSELGDCTPEQFMGPWDVVVQRVGSGYAHVKYRVLKNTPNLSTRDLAVICDSGNLCFGYRTEGSIICVYTD